MKLLKRVCLVFGSSVGPQAQLVRPGSRDLLLCCSRCRAAKQEVQVIRTYSHIFFSFVFFALHGAPAGDQIQTLVLFRDKCVEAIHCVSLVHIIV